LNDIIDGGLRMSCPSWLHTVIAHNWHSNHEICLDRLYETCCLEDYNTLGSLLPQDAWGLDVLWGVWLDRYFSFYPMRPCQDVRYLDLTIIKQQTPPDALFKEACTFFRRRKMLGGHRMPVGTVGDNSNKYIYIYISNIISNMKSLCFGFELQAQAGNGALERNSEWWSLWVDDWRWGNAANAGHVMDMWYSDSMPGWFAMRKHLLGHVPTTWHWRTAAVLRQGAAVSENHQHWWIIL
jgi:hypothetical protein